MGALASLIRTTPSDGARKSRQAAELSGHFSWATIGVRSGLDEVEHLFHWRGLLEIPQGILNRDVFFGRLGFLLTSATALAMSSVRDATTYWNFVSSAVMFRIANFDSTLQNQSFRLFGPKFECDSA